PHPPRPGYGRRSNRRAPHRVEAPRRQECQVCAEDALERIGSQLAVQTPVYLTRFQITSSLLRRSTRISTLPLSPRRNRIRPSTPARKKRSEASLRRTTLARPDRCAYKAPPSTEMVMLFPGASS